MWRRLSVYLAYAISTVSAVTVSVSVPATAPTIAATLDPALVSLSIEQDRWPDWVGVNEMSEFMTTALANLKDRTGTPPYFRIGADSEDRTNFNPAVNISQIDLPAGNPTTPYPEASSVVVGQGYYDLAGHLPAGTQVIWGVNLRSANLTAAFLEAQAIKIAFDGISNNVTLRAIEIGNEPNLYGSNGSRNSSTWNVTTYVEQWTQFAENVSVAAGVTSASSAPKFFGGAFAGSTVHTNTSFSPEGAIAAGLLDSDQGHLITEMSQHLYIDGGGNITIAAMLNKTGTRANLTSYLPEISAVQGAGIPFVLGETNSYSGHGHANVSDVGGAAIWTIDYTLLAATLGVKRVHFHEGIGYKYNLIQPITLTVSPDDASNLSTPLEPHVQPGYYGALVVDEAVGDSGSSTIAELSINDDTLSGYAIYEDGGLTRVVLLNLEPYLSDSTEPRPTATIALDVGRGFRKAGLKRLFMEFADIHTGLTWAGQSFDTPNDSSARGVLHTSSIQVSGGVATITLNATEAVLLNFA